MWKGKKSRKNNWEPCQHSSQIRNLALLRCRPSLVAEAVSIFLFELSIEDTLKKKKIKEGGKEEGVREMGTLGKWPMGERQLLPHSGTVLKLLERILSNRLQEEKKREGGERKGKKGMEKRQNTRTNEGETLKSAAARSA